MAIQHTGVLFDSKGFIERASPLIDALSNGDSTPLFNEANAIINQKTFTDWVSREIGNWPPENIEYLLENSDPFHVGWTLMVVLADHLSEEFSMGINHRILTSVLRKKFWWRKKEIDLLLEGKHVAKLIQPEIKIPKGIISSQSSYLLHIRFSHTKGSGGWLSKQDIERLYKKINKNKNTIENFNHKRFGHYWNNQLVTVPEGQLEFLAMLHEGYAQTTKMLETALDANQELFVVFHF